MRIRHREKGRLIYNAILAFLTIFELAVVRRRLWIRKIWPRLSVGYIGIPTIISIRTGYRLHYIAPPSSVEYISCEFRRQHHQYCNQCPHEAGEKHLHET